MNLAVLEALNLSGNESAVLEALMGFRYPKNVATIARKAGLPRTTTLYVLHKFKKRMLAKHVRSLSGRHAGEGKRMQWIFYKRTSRL